MKAIVLLSGGLDSSTCLAQAIRDCDEVIALSINYNQRHSIELDCAKRISEYYGVEHIILPLPLDEIGGSALTSSIPVPEGVPKEREIPITYVPARNTILLSLALALSEVREAEAIYIGVNSIDYSNYPDCRGDFIACFEELAKLGTRAGREGRGVKIFTPLLNLTKAEIVLKAIELGLDMSLTSSCYNPNPDGNPCGICSSCMIRAKGFKEAGVEDPMVKSKRG